MRKSYTVSLGVWFMLTFAVICLLLGWPRLLKESPWFFLPVISLILAAIVACMVRFFWRLDLTDAGISFKCFRKQWSTDWDQVKGWCCIEGSDQDVYIFLKLKNSTKSLVIHQDFLSPKNLKEICEILQKHCSKPMAAKDLLTESELPMFFADKQI